MIVQILVDNKKSWYVPYAHKLKAKLERKGKEVYVIHDHSEVILGDILCLISCEKLYKNLELNKSNIVIHESELPKGKGWSPLSWQVLECKDEIPITLFEAQDDLDSGQIYAQSKIKLTGEELLNEIKEKQGVLTNKMIEEYILAFPNVSGIEQKGESTFYNKRTPKDSDLDINKSISDQFNLLRIVDNENYPAFFIKNNVKYYLKIYKKE